MRFEGVATFKVGVDELVNRLGEQKLGNLDTQQRNFVNEVGLFFTSAAKTIQETVKKVIIPAAIDTHHKN